MGLVLAVCLGGHQRKPLNVTVETAVLRQLTGAVNLGLGITVELTDVERALGQNAHVVLEVPLLNFAGGDELVDVFETLVVAGVAHDRAVVGDVNLTGFMLETAHCGVLDRGGVRVRWVNLYQPEEAVRLVRLLGDIEAVVVLLPRAVGQLFILDRVALELLNSFFVVELANVAEVLVNVLLTGQVGTPRSNTTGAVVQSSLDLHTGRVSLGLQQIMTSSRAVDCELGEASNATVTLVAENWLQESLVILFHSKDGLAVGSQSDVDLLLSSIFFLVSTEHHRLGGVLVRADVQQCAVFSLNQASEVIVEAELLQLVFRSLLVKVELRATLVDWVAPANQNILLVAVRDNDCVFRVRLDGFETHTLRRFVLATVTGSSGTGGVGATCGAARIIRGASGQHGATADRKSTSTSDLQCRATGECALGERLLRNITEVLVVRELVRSIVSTGITTLVSAGQRAARGSKRICQQILANTNHGETAFV